MGLFGRSLGIALSALFIASAAQAVPLTFQVNFSSGRTPTFNVDSSLYLSSSKTTSYITLSSPFYFGGSVESGLLEPLQIDFLSFEFGQGTIDLSGPGNASANPFIPYSTFVSTCGPFGGCISVLAGGRNFNGGDGVYEDSIRYGVAGIDGDSTDRGTYTITLLTPIETPLLATLPLFAAGLGTLAWFARQRRT